MPNVRELLERESTTVDLEHGHFERMLRRRDRKRRNQRIAAGAIGIVIVLLGLLTVARAINTAEQPADETNPQTFTGMVIRNTGAPYSRGDLVAVDPSTGEAITVVDSQSLPGDHPAVIYNAAISGDGRWVAFDVASGCGKGGPGLWVTNGEDQPRNLTNPCYGSLDDLLGLWGWSPSGDKLLVVLGSPGGEALFLIDPVSLDRTNLGALGDVTSVAWSPDETLIAYGTVPPGSPNGNSRHGSVETVSLNGDGHIMIAESIGQVPGGEEGAGIQWSPDGARIAVLADADPGSPRGRLYVMNADGSGRRPLAENVVIEHVLGSPNIVWSPDGTRIAYATMSDEGDKLQIWNGSPSGSTPVLVFDATSSPGDGTLSGGPVWSPDGTQIAFRYDPTGGEKGWLVANADGTGAVHEIDELQYLSWRGGWYFCECYG